MVLTCLCGHVAARGAEPGQIIQVARPGLFTDVSAQASYWMDNTGQAAIETVSARPDLFVATGTRSWPLQVGNALWIRLVLPPLRGPDRWYLDNTAPSMDRTTLYLNSADGWQAIEAGDKVPVVRWPSPERMPTFRLPSSQTEVSEVFIRIENQFSTTPRLRLWRDGDLSQVREGEYLLLGGFFALALMIVVSCAAQGFFYRDKVFAWFGGFALLLALTQAALTGLLGQFVLTDNPWLLDRSVYLAPMAATVMALWFVREVTDLRSSAAWLYQTAFWYGILGFGFLAWFLVRPEQSVFVLYNLYIVSAFVFAVGAFALAKQRGDPYALWFMLSFGVLIAGSGLVILRNLEILPAHFFVQNAPTISAALAIPICYWVTQTRARALYVAQARANALQTKDALTGLANRQSFEFRLPITLARANSQAVNGALLLIEVVNLDQLAKAGGEEWRERGLVVAAARLRDLSRDVDLLARVGPARFALLMEGPTNRAEAADIATRAVARGLQQTTNLPPGQALTLHVAVLMLPEHGSEPGELLANAEQLLQRIRRHPQRKVQFPDAQASSGLNKPFDPKALDEMQRQAEAALGPDSGSDDGMHKTRNTVS